MSNKLTRAIKSYLNKDTFATFGNSVLSLIKGPIIMLLVASCVSETTQGYWYTFGSLSALSALADLGFGTLVGQFSAHEFSQLSFDKQMRFVGEKERIEKMAGLFKYVIKWAICVCLIAYPIIYTIGIFVLNAHGGFSAWIIPWTIFILSGSISFVAKIVLSFFEGCGQIHKIQSNYLISTLVISIASIIMLVLKCDLYALAVPSLLGAIANIILLFCVFGRPLSQVFNLKIKTKYNWSKQFLRLIWKYAISWGCGYLVFQLYTPMAFLKDPILGGKVGITLTLVQACFVISNTFNSVLQPKLNMAVASHDWPRAEGYVYKGTAFSMAMYLMGAAVILFSVGFLVKYISLFNRFLDIATVSWLLVAWFLQIIINTIATYGRAHKQEPFLYLSIVSALLTVGSTLFLMEYLPFNYFFMGFAISNFLSAIVFVLMFIYQKDKWHAKLIALQESEAKDKSLIDIGGENDNPPSPNIGNDCIVKSSCTNSDIVDSDANEITN